MKRILVSTIVSAILAGVGAASAADLQLKAPPAPVVLDPGWNGFYVGANVGYSWGRSDATAAIANATTGVGLAAGAASFDMNGWVGGFQAGYNLQRDRWVFGIETDFQWTGQDGGATFACPGTVCNRGLTAIPAANAPVSVALTEKLQWFGTLRGRLGTTFVNPNWLFYVTGGLAYGSIQTNGTISGFNALGVGVGTGFSNSATNVGWTVGVGLEGRLMGNWTAKAEYLYVDLGTVTTNAANTLNFIPIALALNSNITDNIFRVGVNYQFH
jgi:outer membrane immunogenic protein